MDKLAAVSRRRWPTDDLPSEWTFPGMVPMEAVPALRTGTEQQQSVERL